MQTGHVNGIELEYELSGTGEPVLLISPVLPNGFDPLVAEPSLAERYQWIRYHKRGWAGSTHPTGPVGVGDHVRDAVALLDHLEVPRAHVIGHSSGASVAAQMALDMPERVATLGLFELALTSVPSGAPFLQGAAPVFEAYAEGNHEAAVAMFLSTVSGVTWDDCRSLLERRIPGEVAHVVKDADTLFGVELPAALVEWTFSAEQTERLRQPVLSVLGGSTQPLWVDTAEFLRTHLPHCEERTIKDVGHFLHIQEPEPVAHAVAEFLSRHPLT